mmetsp:Transcript_20864/g.30940  ORF Transcript_20864/g.30940 Transcript_20864/m.30940 type:complete len:415 (-) Transcript_20864:298-1542(-)|eukprot:CAMPEP_0171455426 /NCGR_PEP_ID=MMETSP0945-20130129/2328_1 /TAXON_ID=109269 /ORGANISM="Vaucheria litorea, Strain CCMP2940" /LENGTH=414 /DNA_ID=CAMNT_0011980669 /DNA_START=239 /DNA_END=1483 /DNA_ORIENTATION=+
MSYTVMFPGLDYIGALDEFEDVETRKPSHISIANTNHKHHRDSPLPVTTGLISKENYVVSDNTWIMSDYGYPDAENWASRARNHNTDKCRPGFRFFDPSTEEVYVEHDLVMSMESLLKPVGGNCSAHDPFKLTLPLFVPCKPSPSFDKQRKWELNTQVPSNFLTRHMFLNETNRYTMITWMVKSQQYFNLGPESLFLAVNLIDRYLGLTQKMETLHSYSVISVAALHTASKYEENRNPGLLSILEAAGGRYTKKQIIDAELKLLCTLNFKVGAPTLPMVLSSCIQSLNPPPTEQMSALCGNIAESLLFEVDAASDHMPCDLARATVAAACRLIDPQTYEDIWYSQICTLGEDVPLKRAFELVWNVLWHGEKQNESSLAQSIAQTMPQVHQEHSNIAQVYVPSWTQRNLEWDIFQ